MLHPIPSTPNQAQPSPRQARLQLTTPQWLRSGMYAVWLVSVLLLLATIASVKAQRQALHTLGKDTASSVITAQRMKDALSGMDAFAANELLNPNGQANQAAADGFRERRDRLAERLVLVAENISYGDQERTPILVIQRGLGIYLTKLQQARDGQTQKNSKQTIAAFREAATLLDDSLIPAAEALNRANWEELTRSYQTQQQMVWWLVAGTLTVSGALVALLVALQLFLNRRTRRVFNPGLLGATAIAVLLEIYTVQALISSSQALKLAKEDAFDSIYALRQIRALVYGMVADQSRHLIDPQQAFDYERDFRKKSNQIIQLSSEQRFEDLDLALLVRQNRPLPALTGLMAQQLGNITFPGEREAMADHLLSLRNYLTANEQLHRLQRLQQSSEAIDLMNQQINQFRQRLLQVNEKLKDGKPPVCQGAQNQPNCYLTQLMDANLTAFAINKKAFNQALVQGFGAVGGYEVIIPADDDYDKYAELKPKPIDEFVVVAAVATGAIAGLTLLGLRPRLREYSF